MRTRSTRPIVDRGYNTRPNYNRLDDSDVRGPRYNSPGRYRDYDYNSSREHKDNYPPRDYTYRDYNPGREFNSRDHHLNRDFSREYPNTKDYNSRDYPNKDYNSRDYPNTKDFNARDYPSSREYINPPREYPNNSRELVPPKRDFHPNNRDFNVQRDFQTPREFYNRDFQSNREYPPQSRDYNRYRDYTQTSRSYPPNNRDMVEHDKFYQDRRYYRERITPYDTRNAQRNDMRRYSVQSYDSDPKRSGPVRRTNQNTRVHKTKVFIGNLSGEVTQEELTNKFSTFGPINRIDFRRKFAFVDYVRSKDADTAIREMHNKLIWGSWLKVQPHIEQQKKLSSREPKPSFQITVTNLDQSVSWQDLKDFARQAGDVNYASIIIKGDKRFGLIEFTNDNSVKNAMKDLNGKKIVSNKLELIHIPVSEFLKKLGYNNENIVVEEQPEEEEGSNSLQQNEGDFTENDKYNNDTFEAEDNSKSPSQTNLSTQDDLYQQGNLDTVDYN